MLAQHSLTQLKVLRLEGMAKAFEEQLVQPGCAELSFEERIAMLIDREVSCRDTRRVDRLLKQARLKTSSACLEDVDYRAGRALERKLLAALGSGDWIRQHHNCLITGPTGSGKTWLACALGNAACRQALSVLYVRLHRLFEELHIAHGDGRRWPGLTLHLNVEAALSRQHHRDLFLGTIVEGPQDWVVRPVGEAFCEHEVGSARTTSALVGAIWQVRENVSIDAGVRGARVNDSTLREFRVGMTFGFPIR